MKIILTESQYRMCLLEDFKTQKIKYIQQGYPENTVEYYLNYFREIKDKKYKQLFDTINGVDVKNRIDIDSYKNFKDLEIVVDYVKGQVNVNKNTKIDIKNDIKTSGKPIYEDENVLIYYADSPKACVQYKGSVPYSWCIARKDSSNMYNTYRYRNHEPAFYFVKIKDRTKKELNVLSLLKTSFNGKFKDPYHFFVVQVIKNANIKDETKKQYYVTSANNDGDKYISWNNILEIDPKLKNLQYLFVPKPLSEEEKNEYNLFKDGISDEKYCKLLFERKKNYINITLKLSDKKFECTPDELKNFYIGMGIGLSDYQFDLIKNNDSLVKRSIQIANRLIEEVNKNDDALYSLTSYHFKIADKNLVKKVLINYYNNHINSIINGILKITINNEVNFINAKGDFIFNTWLKWVDDFYEGLAIIEDKNNKFNFINTNGEIISSVWFRSAKDFLNGFAEVKNDDGETNFINTNGKLVIDKWIKYEVIGDFKNNLVPVQNIRYFKNFINTDGNLISDTWFKSFYYLTNGLIYVNNMDYDVNLINSDGNFIFDDWLDKIEDFNYGFAIITNNDGKSNFINDYGKIISDIWFNEVYPFKRRGYAMVQNDNDEYNYINSEGDLISNVWFDYGESFDDIYAR